MLTDSISWSLRDLFLKQHPDSSNFFVLTQCKFELYVASEDRNSLNKDPMKCMRCGGEGAITLIERDNQFQYFNYQQIINC